ncbi:MAG: hypothetical protein ACRD63_01185 [Pyrinomonadaceae bacterium]
MEAKTVLVDADKIGSAVSLLGLSRTLTIIEGTYQTRAGDVVVARALTDSATYNQLELPTGRLAKINPGDVIVGVLGSRRALKGFVGDAPYSVSTSDELHLLNMGGLIGRCTGHHSSLSDAIKVEVLGLVCEATSDTKAKILNISDNALKLTDKLSRTAPLVLIVGACMNSGKTFAATELIKQATRVGVRVAAGKLAGVACLRDTLHMTDHGAIATASFLDCGLPSTVGLSSLAPVAKTVINKLNEVSPDLIIIELGDGILGGYGVDSIFDDAELRAATAALVFCASDYVAAWGGIEWFARRGIRIDLIAGSVTDSVMGEEYIEREFGVPAGNARRDGVRLFQIVKSRVDANDLPEPVFIAGASQCRDGFTVGAGRSHDSRPEAGVT